MVSNSGSKKDEPRKYFSTLYYSNQESRKLLPTAEEQAELAKLKTNYEGTRYQVPLDRGNIVDVRALFREIEEIYATQVSNQGDMRWFREHTVNTEGNDYDYRFWLQYQVEEISAGNRSMRLLKSRSKEFNNTLSKLADLSLKVAENLYQMANDVLSNEITNNIHPLSYLIELNDMVKHDIIIRNKVISIHFQYERDCDNNRITKFVEDKPLFYHLSNTMLQVFFKSIRKSTKLKYFNNKKELIDALAELDFHDVDGKSIDDLLDDLGNELVIRKNRDLIKKYYTNKFVCETNSFFRKLHNKVGKILKKWSIYYGAVPRKKKLDFFRIIYLMSRDNNEKLIQEDLSVARKKFRNLSIKTATSCLFSAFNANLINFDAASVDELDSLYDADYEHSGTSYPNVVRMSNHLFKDLNEGDHAIIRHFQMDEKRNMYCLPKNHSPFPTGERGKGGFLHNEQMSVSLHPALLNLMEEKRLDYTRFEPTSDTLVALNMLQQTQWSINLDFLNFIADFTFEGKKVNPYPIDIRQSAWQRSDNMELKEIFIDKMSLRSQDEATKSRFRTVKANLKQARKNLFNSGNVFWHPWFCDWRGRFNTKVNELSPQGDDLSKAMLLFTEWKPLGETGRDWLYVRAYELLRKIFAPESDKLAEFSKQVKWVEEHLQVIIEDAEKLNRHTSDDELEELLDKLQVRKPGPKSQIFQRIAFLIEFNRIQKQYAITNDWDLVSSGLPIHLDASCNGFQHIAALTRNEKLARSVNLLNHEDNEKGDLYQEVATEAKDSFQKGSEESKELRELIAKICDSKSSKKALIEGIFTRDFCKPLVMITGYGARDLASPIMNLNGKKRRGGRFKLGKDKKSIPTLHHESLLYQVIEEIQSESGGLDKLILVKDRQGYMTPIENCVLAREFGLALGNYIRYCIGVVTDFKFEEIKENLEGIYNKIDTLGISTPVDCKYFDNLKSAELRQILLDNQQSVPRKKHDRLLSVRKLALEKWKNKLYFTWKASDYSSIVRYVKWKLDHNRSQGTLPTAILPKNYVDPGESGIEQFIQNSTSLTKELKQRLKQQRQNISKLSAKKTQKNQSQSVRKLKNLVMMCLRNIYLTSNDEDEKQLAKNHLLARFIELKGDRTHDGKKNSHRFSIDTGNDMKFNVESNSGFKNSIGKLFDLTNEIHLGMVPNFIHSFDALHMQNVIIELQNQGIQDIWAVHDSFGVHPCDIDTLREIVNRTFVELHSDSLETHLKRIIDLNYSILDQDYVDEKISDEIKCIENDWINEVLEANYLIS